MSNNGEVILKLFNQVRQVCEQVSSLLQTADDMMTKADCKSEGNNALYAFSYSIMNPSQWIPTVAFRFYRHKDYPKRLAFISVLLDNDWEGYYTIKEPYVTAGFLNFGEAEASLQSDYWFSQYFGYLLQDFKLKPDGQPFPFENEKLRDNLKGRFKSGTVFGVPLVSITNANDIESQIISKLLNLLKNT